MSPGGSLQDRLARALGQLGAPRRLGVAVSGGGDSLALLHLLHASGAFQLKVATVDHGLRPEARAEAGRVADICAGLGLAHRRLDWHGWGGSGNLQDQARRARYRLLGDWGRAQGIHAIALGHTLDDQAETMLMRLGRRAGVDGLSRMAGRFERDGMTFLRPLLEFRRAELRHHLRGIGATWSEDPSNEDEAYHRVRARASLEALAPLGVGAEDLARVSAHLASARQALQRRAAGLARRIARVEAGSVALHLAALAELPGEDRRRLLSGALLFVAPGDYAPRAEALDRLEQAIDDRRTATLAGCLVVAAGPWLYISREAEALRGMIGPTNALWDGHWRLEGPHAPDLHVAVLGEAGLTECKTWRDAGLPRPVLAASPAVWRGDGLIAAPIARYNKDWSAHSARNCDDYARSLISH